MESCFGLMPMEIGSYEIVTAIVSGILVGYLLGLFGGGGSVLAAPLLLYVVGVPLPHVAIGTSAAAVSVNAGVNLLGHWRAGRVKWPCATVFALAGLLGSIAGSTVAKNISGDLLLFGFAIAMISIALSMLRARKSEGDPEVTIDWRLVLRLAPVGLLAGFAAGFFGIGGGFLIIPGLMLAAGMTVSNAAASSLVSVTVFGAATASNYALSGLVDWQLFGLLLLGGLLGGVGGIMTAGRLAVNMALLRKSFAGLVILVGLIVAHQAITGLGWI